MPEKYFPPQYDAKEFHCIRCGVYAHQIWSPLQRNTRGSIHGTEFTAAQCVHCHEFTFWFGEQMVVPADSPAPPPHTDLPEDCRTEYDEARAICGRSPRAAAALLRLVVQKLITTLGESGTNINSDIKSLVAKGLPVQVQQAFDYCRVVGNNAVHPGVIDLNDTPEIAQNLFSMINFIVEDRIARPKEIARLYDKLPQSARKAVAERDGAPRKDVADQVG